SSRPPSRSGNSMSRIAAIGTRTSSRARGPSGRTNACTTIDAGMSWAAAVDGSSTSAAASSGRITVGVYCARFRDPLRGPHMKRSTVVAVAAAMCTAVVTAQQSSPPSFQVDPLWPRPLPNHWLLGSVTGVAVDAPDHVWVVHRGYDSMTARTEIGAATNPKTADDCCVPAPQVLEFDAAGTLLSHWGGPGDKFDWPVSLGGVAVDATGAVWIAAAGPPEIPGSANATPPRAGGAGRGAGGGGQGRGTVTPAPPKPQDAHV